MGNVEQIKKLPGRFEKKEVLHKEKGEGYVGAIVLSDICLGGRLTLLNASVHVHLIKHT